MQLTLVLAMLSSAVPVADVLRDLPGLSSPPTAPVTTLAGRVRITQRSCTSVKGAAELAVHFARLFEREGLYFAPEAAQVRPQRGEQVSALDPQNLVSYTVLLQPSGRQTTVVLATADLGNLEAAPKVEPFAPVMAGATGVTAFTLETAQAMTYSVRASPAEIESFYREVLGKAGWSPSTLPARAMKGLAPEGQVEQAPLVFSDGAQVLTVTVSPGVSERYVTVQRQSELSQPR